jgi:ERCC4-type nuclease
VSDITGYDEYGCAQHDNEVPAVEITPDMVIADLRDIAGELARLLDEYRLGAEPVDLDWLDRVDEVLARAREKGLLTP